MRQAVVLGLSLLWASCSVLRSKPKVSYPVRADTFALSIVEYSSPISAMNECTGAEYSNISCPFRVKRTISFQESFVEEERCSCFPEITHQKTPLSHEEKEFYLGMAQNIHTLDDHGSSCVADFIPAALILQGRVGEETFLITKPGWKSCGSRVAYVDEIAANSLNDSLGYAARRAPITQERALRKIYNEHNGFSIVFPQLLPGNPACPWQRSYTYNADARSIEVSRCDGDRGLGSRTIPFDETENERLLTALRALEAPTVDAYAWSCMSRPVVSFELYKKNGKPDPFEFDGTACHPKGLPQAVDYRRRLFTPSAAGFIDLLEAYDNF
ncbi:MAG TPA: hypothetical protein VFO10_06320 [Oligoflexus sp.]|uniref:hypothetical protein n=1 Tax=Oligoflexus sp. TaxID=1971216 RepID=UPI002D7FE1A9|nr:hypothetical protein [Oligoflexus sp.]HET9236845.1 hypothetical protein [Oligoflexus sp.]